MFHLAGYFLSVGQTADSDMAALTDQILYIQNSHFVPQSDMYLHAAFASSATISRAKLVSPSLRQIANPYIVPVSPALLPPGNPNMMDMRDHPLTVRALEELQVQITSGLSMGNENAYALLWLATGQMLDPAPVANYITLRATGGTTAVAHTWTDCPLTFDQAILSGTYAIAGMLAQGTTMVAARLILDGQVWRPGVLGQATNSQTPWPQQLAGRLGLFGTFRSTSLPRMQILCNAADTTQEVYLQVAKVG